MIRVTVIHISMFNKQTHNADNREADSERMLTEVREAEAQEKSMHTYIYIYICIYIYTHTYAYDV